MYYVNMLLHMEDDVRLKIIPIKLQKKTKPVPDVDETNVKSRL